MWVKALMGEAVVVVKNLDRRLSPPSPAGLWDLRQ